MAIEKMTMVHLLGEASELDDIAKEIILFGKFHAVSGMAEIESSEYQNYFSDEQAETFKDVGFDSLVDPGDFRAQFEKIERMLSHLNITKKNMVRKLEDENAHFDDVTKLLDTLYPELEGIQKELRSLRDKREHMELLKALSYINNTDLDLGKLFQMKHFLVKLGVLTKENRTKLAMNYENIPGIIMHLGEVKGKEAMLIACPHEATLEIERILRSVYFDEINVPKEYWVNTQSIQERLDKDLALVEEKIQAHENKKKEYRKTYKDELRYVYNLIKLELTKTDIKKMTAISKNFVCLAGWMPKRNVEDLNKRFKRAHLNFLIFESDEGLSGSHHQPPTELYNNWLFKPFEMLVKLYGIPSYGEIDPTPLFGIIYMILFGAMFGDLGQGLVFLVAGLISVALKKMEAFGAILSRLGISSMAFGVLYDSFFGYEHVISGWVSDLTGIPSESLFFVRPLENMNLILVSSVILGVTLLTIAFSYGIYNKLRKNDIQEALFGKNGLAGLIFMAGLISVICTFAGILDSGYTPVALLVSGGCLLTILFREPLTNLLRGHRPLYHESVGEYYMESGFEMIETLLSVFSNVMSFIRVGAFALNHVGLFLAFHTLAALIGGAVGEISMFIVGNIVIIVLEGLIVFIQGLRLMFYELFSKYYTGEGFDYKPVQF